MCERERSTLGFTGSDLIVDWGLLLRELATVAVGRGSWGPGRTFR